MANLAGKLNVLEARARAKTPIPETVKTAGWFTAKGFAGWWITRALQDRLTPGWFPDFLRTGTDWLPAVGVTAASWMALPARHALPVSAGAIIAAMKGRGAGSGNTIMDSLADAATQAWSNVKSWLSPAYAGPTTPLDYKFQAPPWFIRAPTGSPAHDLLTLQSEVSNSVPMPNIARPW